MRLLPPDRQPIPLGLAVAGGFSIGGSVAWTTINPANIGNASKPQPTAEPDAAATMCVTHMVRLDLDQPWP